MGNRLPPGLGTKLTLAGMVREKRRGWHMHLLQSSQLLYSPTELDV